MKSGKVLLVMSESRPISCNEVLLIFGKEGGKDAWYFVSVGKLKKPLLLHMLKGPRYNLNSLGTIVESGWGKEPSKASRDKWLK